MKKKGLTRSRSQSSLEAAAGALTAAAPFPRATHNRRPQTLQPDRRMGPPPPVARRDGVSARGRDVLYQTETPPPPTTPSLPPPPSPSLPTLPTIPIHMINMG